MPVVVTLACPSISAIAGSLAPPARALLWMLSVANTDLGELTRQKSLVHVQAQPGQAWWEALLFLHMGRLRHRGSVYFYVMLQPDAIFRVLWYNTVESTEGAIIDRSSAP
jgi:hypothetical protein